MYHIKQKTITNGDVAEPLNYKVRPELGLPDVNELLNIVKIEVEEVFGRKVATSRDCIQLSEEIHFKSGSRINSNTLRRFFGLVKAPHPPSRSTLYILSIYCGFNSFDELVSIRRLSEENSHPGSYAPLLNYLVTLYKLLSVRGNSDETLLILVKHTLGFIYSNSKLTDKFHKSMVKSQAGQELFFQQFVHIDHINAAFGRGIRYYLNEKKTTDAQVFGYSLLCFRDWLSDDFQALKKNFEFIRKMPLPVGASLLVHCYYLSAHLLYAHAFGLDSEKIILDAYKIEVEQHPSDPVTQLAIKCHLSCSFLLSGHFEEALYTVNTELENWSGYHTLPDKGLYQKLLLLKSLALVWTNRKEDAEKIFVQLCPSQFYFFTKKLDTILFLLLTRSLKKGSFKIEEQLEALIKETGFYKFYSIE